MSPQMTELMRRLETRVMQLLEQRDTLSKQVSQLQQQLANEKAQQTQLQEQCTALGEQLAHLKMAKYIDMADNDAKDLRGRVRQMVRDIDKCIAMLKADENV